MFKICIVFAGIINCLCSEEKAYKEFADPGEVFFNHNNSKMLDISQLQLDVRCIEGRGAFGGIEIVTSSAKECINECRKYQEMCNVLLWKQRDHSCFLTSYHSLNACVLSSPLAPISYVVMVNVSIRAPSYIKKELLKFGLRSQIQSILRCNESEFVCDDWKCASSPVMCDENADCDDCTNSATKCMGSNGVSYLVGEEYVTFGMMGQCQVCKCGNFTSFCTSLMCDSQPLCDIKPLSLCCQCTGFDTFDDHLLNSSQRLIISLLFILLVLLMIIFYSRYSGTSCPSQTTRNRRSVRLFLSLDVDPASGRPVRSTFTRNTETVALFDGNGLPLEYGDRPPAYSSLKPPERPPTPTPPPSYSSHDPSFLADQDGLESCPMIDPSDESSQPIATPSSQNQPITTQNCQVETCEQPITASHSRCDDLNQPMVSKDSNEATNDDSSRTNR